MRVLELFSGCGGGLLASIILGHEPVCAVELDPYCCQVLRERAAEGWFPNLQVWEGDIREFDGRPWAGKVDCVAGGFPCNDISIAGKGDGIEGDKSGLWREMARIVGEVRPHYVFVENSPMLTSRGLGRVLGDLASLGFDAEWDCFSAHEAGAPHLRERLFILAYADGKRWDSVDENKQERCSDFNPQIFEAWRDLQAILRISMETSFDNPVRGVLRNDDGISDGMDRIKSIGNAQCPQAAALAWRELYGSINS